MKHILEQVIDRGAFLVRDHRYGLGYTAAIVSSFDCEEVFGALTDDSGSLPWHLQPALSQHYVPVFVAAGRTAEEAITALDAKIVSMSERELDYAVHLLSNICQEAAVVGRSYEDWWKHLDPDMNTGPWVERLKRDGYIEID